MAMRRCVVLHEADAVAVLLEAGHVGDHIQVGDLTIELRDEVPRFHKVCIRPLNLGDEVRKMGEVIGVATRPIGLGSHVHVTNLRSLRGRR